MKTLNKVAENNIGGLLKFWLVPHTNVNSLEKNFNTGIYTITFKEEDNNWLIYCTPETMKYYEKENDSLGSVYYESELTGFVPNDAADQAQQFELIKNRKWLVVFLDDNGNYKLIGDVSFPMLLIKEYDSGTATTDRKGYYLRITGSTPKGSVFINNPF